MKMFKKISAILLAVLLIAALSTTAFASAAYTAIPGGTVNFNKYLVLSSDAEVPNVTFEYSIEAGAAMDMTETTVAVIAGPVVEAGGKVTAPTVGTAVFAPTDAKAATVASGDSVTLASDQSYAKKSVTIDFSGVTFPEPGVYRYLLKETSAGQQGISYDTQLPTGGTAKQRTVDVYVIDNNGALKIAAYVMHTGTDAPRILTTTNGTGDVSTAGDPLTDKSDGFVNDYGTVKLGFAKEVSGNQASRDKFFKFTLSITNAGSGTVMNVTVCDNAKKAAKTAATRYETAAMQAANGVTTLTADENGAVTHDFYLSHGDTVLVTGLPQGASYTVTEDAEDYKSAEGTTIEAVAASGTAGEEGYVAAKLYNGLTNGTIAAEDAYTGYTNTRDGLVPTGVMLTVIPGVVIVALAIVGLIFLSKKKKEEET